MDFEKGSSKLIRAWAFYDWANIQVLQRHFPTLMEMYSF